MFVRVRKRAPYIGGAVLFMQCARRARRDTLTAIHTGRINQRLVINASHARFESAAPDAYRAYFLHIIAGCNATAAKYAFAVISHDGRTEVIHHGLSLASLIGVISDTKLRAKRAELAISCPDA